MVTGLLASYLYMKWSSNSQRRSKLIEIIIEESQSPNVEIPDLAEVKAPAQPRAQRLESQRELLYRQSLRKEEGIYQESGSKDDRIQQNGDGVEMD